MNDAINSINEQNDNYFKKIKEQNDDTEKLKKETMDNKMITKDILNDAGMMIMMIMIDLIMIMIDLIMKKKLL